MSSVAQMLRQAEALKASVSDSTKTISETWGVRQKLEDTYKKVLLIDLEYALDKKVEQELWNYAFKNQITTLQTQAKDRQNVKRAEIQASLNLFLETASGFYLQFLQLLCTTFKLDLPFRRKSSFYGIMREKTPLKLKVTPPKKSSCLYVCQYCLVHLGDIARYRQQIDQAQTYYWHAASLVPFNGQPYNQLAILEAAKGNKLSTVFYYIRSLAVKVPFPVAATNLEKLYAKLAKETPDFKGKLSASEMITGFLQFHALVHLCTDLEKAEELGEKLASGLSAHVTSQSFPWQVLVQIVAINLFAMNHVQPAHGGDADGMANGNDDLTDDETRCFNLVFNLTVTMLDILLQYTPKQEHKVREYFTLPAIKLIMDWLKLNPQNFDKPVLKLSPLWGNLCKVLNSIQLEDLEEDVSKYEDLPLPEDAELRCFQPIEKAQSTYSYSKVPAEGLLFETEVQLRCERLIDQGRWIVEEQPSLNLSAQTVKSGRCQFMYKSQPQSSLVKPSARLMVNNSSPAPSPERKTARQNVAIQAIMQKQAKDNKENIKVKVDPSSPKYLLGVPTNEPMFFKTGSAGGRQSNQSSPSASKSPVNSGTAHTGGVLVLKNQDHLLQSGSPGSKSPAGPQTQKSQTWQQQQQQQQQQRAPAGSSWQQSGKQQQQQVVGKPGWQNNQISPQNQPRGQGQMSPWQQNQGTFGQPPLSPQGSPGQWPYPNPPLFGRNDLRPNTMTTSQPNVGARPPPGPMMNMGMIPPGHMFTQPPTFTQGQGQNKQGQSAGGQGDDKYMSESQMKGHISQGQLSQGQMPPQGQIPFGDVSNRFPKPNMGHDGISVQQGDRFRPLNMTNFGSGDGTNLPFGGNQHPAMFRHPPPPPNTRFPPPQTFPHNSPRPDGQGNIRPSVQTQQMPGQHGNIPPGVQNDFSHAPGTERPMGIRPGAPAVSQNQRQMQMAFQQGQFMNPMQPPFLGYPNLSNNNQMKSPLEGLFGKPRYPHEEFPPNVADIIGTLTKMSIQQPRDSPLPPQRGGISAFQGHAEGTPKPENFYNQQRSSSVPVVNIDIDNKLGDSVSASSTPPSQGAQLQQGTYSLFSGSPWLSSGDSKSLGSSPFSSQSSSMRNSPDPNSEAFNPDSKSGQMLDMGLRFSNTEDRGLKPGQGDQPNPGPFFQNNMQSIWSTQSQSPLERLLELQKQQRTTDPH